MSPTEEDSPSLSPRTWTFILLGCIATSFVLLVFRFDEPRAFPLPLWFFAAGISIYFGHIIIDNMHRVQIRLAELMLNVLLIAASTSVFLSMLKSSHSLDPLPAVLFPMFLSVIFFGTGSFWGWKSAAQLEEDRTWPRVGLMAYGWMLMIGILCALPFLVTLCLLAFDGPNYPPERLATVLISGAGSLLILPARRVERQIRQHRLEMENKIVARHKTKTTTSKPTAAG